MFTWNQVCCLERPRSEKTGFEEGYQESYMEGGHFIASMIAKAEKIAADILNVSQKFDQIKLSYDRYIPVYQVIQVEKDNSDCSRPVTDRWPLSLETRQAFLKDLKTVESLREDVNQEARDVMAEFSSRDSIDRSTSLDGLSSDVKKFLDLMEKNLAGVVDLKSKIYRLQRELESSIPFYKMWCSIL